MNDQPNETTEILTVAVSRLNLDETIALFCNWIDTGQKKRVCVTPVNCVLWARKDNTLREIYNTSDMNTADGVPLIWASKLLGAPIRGRVTGLDLLPRFAEVSEQRGYSFFFLGAAEGVAEQLSESLKQSHPGLKIAGSYSPPFEERFSNEENAKIVAMVNNASPNVLWVSLSAPKQDIWIYENFEKLNVSLVLGVGGAFEVTAGIIPRAPAWMQNYGLEWAYRFLQEPKRLFARYFIEAPQFLPLVAAQIIKARVLGG